MTKYWITTPSRMPLRTSCFPFDAFTSVNQRIAPESTTMIAEIRPTSIKKAHISERCSAITFAKSTKGLRIQYSIASSTNDYSVDRDLNPLKDRHRFSEITRFVGVVAFPEGNVVTKELQRDNKRHG